MKSPRLVLSLVTATLFLFVASAPSQAAFPNFSDCPRAVSNTCIDIVGRRGNMVIKGFNVPLHDGTLEIRGGLQFSATPPLFVPPAGTNGFFARSVPVPGGLIGLDLPIAFNEVDATPILAGPASSIVIDLARLSITMPIKLKLSNPLLGSSCYIGSNSNPVRLRLLTTTPGTPSQQPTYVALLGGVNSDTTFSIPGASGCALGLGLVNGLINLKLGLPSSSGNNSMTVTSDIGLQPA